MPRPAKPLLIVPLLALAACATPSSASSAPPPAEHMSTHSMPGGSMSHPRTDDVPATARMVCSDDIKTKVQQALQLQVPPATHDTWADKTYTCHYALPMGKMTLTDQVLSDAATARAQMHSRQAADGSARPLAGLGQQAYGSDRGLAVVLKDNQILTVDTTGLPERFGSNDQRRTDLAYEVASVVLGCWTGDE
jgi:hypothetical protein